MEEKIYYVYAYIRLDTNTFFYIGKGKNKRYLRLDNRKEHFMNIYNKVPCVVEILKNNLTEDEAFQLEVDTIYDLVFNEGYSIDIKGIKKNDNGCHLVNCTWGGEGTSGLSIKQSQETIDKRVAKNIGQKRTEEQKQRISKGLKNRKCYNISEETKKKKYESSSYTQGTHVYCIELDRLFSSKKKAIDCMKNEYGIQFNKKSFAKHLNNELVKGNSWYGEIEINGELVKLHWEYC